MFAGHEVGAENWALLASIVATYKLNDVNPATYIAETLQAILNGHPESQSDKESPPFRSTARERLCPRVDSGRSAKGRIGEPLLRLEGAAPEQQKMCYS